MIAPCVVFILRHKVLIRVVDSVNVAQQVLLVVVHVSVVLEPYHALRVVVVFEYLIPDLFRDDLRSVRIVGMRYAVYRLFLAYPVHIVQIAVASATCEHSTPRPRQRFALVARRVPQCVVTAYALRHSVFRHRGQAFIRIVSIRPRYSARKRVARRVVILRHLFDIPEVVVFVEIRLVQRPVVLADQAVDIVVGITDIFPADRPLADVPVLVVLVFIREVQPSEFHFRYERRFSVGADHRYRRFRFSSASRRTAAAPSAHTERRDIVLQEPVVYRVFLIPALFIRIQFAVVFVFFRYDSFFLQPVQSVVYVLYLFIRRQIQPRQRRVRHAVARMRNRKAAAQMCDRSLVWSYFFFRIIFP